jgi:hypothetical protein
MDILFERNVSYPGHIILLDGVSGTGKTMIHRLLDSYKVNHPPRFSYTIEQICIAYHFNKISTDAAITLLKLHLDQLKYDLNIGREINLRKNDLSSILKSSKKYDYLKKLFSEDGEGAISDVFNEKKNVIIVTHQLLETTKLFQKTFNKEFLNLHSVRHPIYLFNHWSTYVPLLGTSVRDLTLWKNQDNQIIPWFFTDSEINKNYATLHVGDKTLVCLIELTRKMISHHQNCEKKPNYLAIEFEKFVLDPTHIIDRMDKVIGSKIKKSIRRILNEEKIPRKNINSGKNLPIYLRYGAGSNESTLNHGNDYLDKLKKIEDQTSSVYFKEFKKTVMEYEQNFELWF